MANRDFKDLPRKTTSEKVLHDKAFDITKNQKYIGFQIGLDSMVYTFFNKKLEVGLLKVKLRQSKH